MTKPYEGFLGDWVLDLSRSRFEQGEAPLAGSYSISEGAEGLTFRIEWTDREGEQHTHSFSGIPDGEARPFPGGELVDAMAISAPSEVELTSRAYFRGRELMIASRRLLDAGAMMEVIQSVLLPDGSKPANVTQYRRKLHS